MNIEDSIKGKGYMLVGEMKDFRIYEKHKKRIIYQISEEKIVDKVYLDNPLKNAEGIKKENYKS